MVARFFRAPYVDRVMAIKKSQPLYLAPLPVKHWFSRASIMLMAAAGVALMIMSKGGNPNVGNLRNSISDAVTPVLSVVASPMDAMAQARAWMGDIARLHEENIALRNQNVQLLKWQTMAQDLEAENKALRGLLGVVPSKKSSYVTARLVSDVGGPYSHSALINAGSGQSVKKNQAVIAELGLVGRVVDAGESSARVLLLNDVNSRVPVIGETSRERSILTGSHDALPVLSYLPSQSTVSVGERVVTSGDGGIFPAGLPVGVVVSVEKGAVKVQPFADPTRIEYVSVVDYAL